MKEVNENPGFPNSLPVEFLLLLQRSWKQQSRDRVTQVGGLPPVAWAVGGPARLPCVALGRGPARSCQCGCIARARCSALARRQRKQQTLV